LSNVGEKTNWI